jgi:hypothetical protein
MRPERVNKWPNSMTDDDDDDLFLTTALHVSGGTSTHHQERIQLYPQHPVFVTPLLLPAAIMAELEIGSPNCRYSCCNSLLMMGGSTIRNMHSSFQIYINCVTLHLVGYILEYVLLYSAVTTWRTVVGCTDNQPYPASAETQVKLQTPQTIVYIRNTGNCK